MSTIFPPTECDPDVKVYEGSDYPGYCYNHHCDTTKSTAIVESPNTIINVNSKFTSQIHTNACESLNHITTRTKVRTTFVDGNTARENIRITVIHNGLKKEYDNTTTITTTITEI
jgi:hypothetical protein